MIEKLKQEIQRAEDSCFALYRKTLADCPDTCKAGRDLLSTVEFMSKYFDIEALRKETFYSLVKSGKTTAAGMFSAESDVTDPESIAETIEDGEWEIARYCLSLCGLYKETLELLSSDYKYDRAELIKTFGEKLIDVQYKI